MSDAPAPPLITAATSAIPGVRPSRMAVLFLVMLVAAAGNTAMQSILPAIGTRLGVPDWWVALAFSWSALLWVLSAPRWAAMSDRRGRRALMALGLIGFASSMLLCGLALHAGLEGWIGAGATFIAFALFRSLYGALGSAAPPAVQAYVAARTDRAHRTAAMALIASSFGLGTVIGPAIAPFLVFPVVGLAGPLFAFAAFGIGVLVALRLILPNDDPRFAARGSVVGYPASGGGGIEVDEEDDDDEGTAPVAARSLSWNDGRTRPWLLAGLLGGHAQAIVFGIMGFVVLDRLGLRGDPASAVAPTGIVLLAGAGATLIAQWGLIPALSIGPRASILWGAALALAGAIVLALAQGLLGMVNGLAIASLGFGLFRPGFTAGVSLAVRRSEQDAVAGQVAATNGAAYIVGPTLGITLYTLSSANHGWLAFALIAAIAAFLLGWGWKALRLEN